MGLGGLHGCNDWARQTGRSGLVAALYGRGGLADGRVRKPGRGGLGDWRTGGRGGLQNPGRGRLGQTGRVGLDRADRGRLEDWRTQRTQRAGRGGLQKTGRIGVDRGGWASPLGRGGLGRTSAGLEQTGLAAADWGGLGRKGRTETDEADGGILGRAWRGVRGGLGITLGEPYHSLACRGDSRSAKFGCGLWGHLAPYTADPHQILWCSCRRPLLGDSHFEGAKTLYQ